LLRFLQTEKIGGKLSKLAKFLTRKLESYGAQVDFSRQTGTSPGTINKWMSGENTPNFESCLLIADYFEADPARVFRMAGKLNYYQLYIRHFDKIQHQTKLHARLQFLLDNGLEQCVEDLLNELEASRDLRPRKTQSN
jgi:transcriptional regulator with XRE-family HTH domain